MLNIRQQKPSQKFIQAINTVNMKRHLYIKLQRLGNRSPVWQQTCIKI